MSIRGSKRRPWLEIVRPETEGRYLSYQLFTLRRSRQRPLRRRAQHPRPDGAITTASASAFAPKALSRPMACCTRATRGWITKQVMDLVGILGLTALWIDRGRINSSKRGSIRGKYHPRGV